MYMGSDWNFHWSHTLKKQMYVIDQLYHIMSNAQVNFFDSPTELCCCICFI